MALSLSSTLANGEGRCVSAAVSTTTLSTYCCWFWMTSMLNNARLFDANTSAGNRRIFITGTNFRYGHTFSGSTAGFDTSISGLSLSTWHHVAITYDASNTTNIPLMYINGVSQSVTTGVAPVGTTTNSANNNHIIGNRLTLYDRAWNGRLAEFAFWNTILAPGQIADLALGAPAYRHNLSSLQLYLPFLGNASDRVQATPGTIAGTPTPSFSTDHPPMRY